ncbi:diacylglycerol/lipid kinase family protein [Paratissierella segnis]|jgi:diacylglycerol kinase (ATP)|uniref:YegS/Rv2252/BmrU family lipid kinase n=1 Tax=Paratissierella segnis TaxID=2763679 RepID=A0A926IFQ8_9FIRM|nr:YegS/Rv2252/BmrU family lipid kinase [Paratissierella segnis]MBC8588762.1 YegS/Rv2252/BmrU family lipid kinase [Paratissierella segnis]
MKKVKFIINPSSGRQMMERKVDVVVKMLLDDGYVVGKYFTEKKDDAMKETIKTCEEDFDMIIVCGGDGTVNEVVKGLVNSKNKLPLAIMAQGTVNDFATYLDIPKNANEFFEMVKNEHIIDIDIGKVNDDYFVNVAACGIFANVGYQVQPEKKAILGRMAYYFEGLKELAVQNIDPIRVKIESEEYSCEDDIMLFVVSNSSSIGGFKKLAPKADVLDGMLDVLIIEKSGPTELANIFLNILSGEHINHPNVKYFNTKSISIDTKEDVPIDVDGEYGGKLPAKFEVVSKGIRIFVK